MRLAFTKCHGSGNDFALLDVRALDLSDAEWGRIARTLCDRSGPVGADGLLLLRQGGGEAAFAQMVVNADGSIPETCLNGLRCTARAGFEALGIDAATVRLKTSNAEVEHEAELAPGVYTVRTTVGPASTDPAAAGLRAAAPVIEAQVPGLPSGRAFTALAMPNPHLIAFVDKVDVAELTALGDWCEAGPELLADRANVSFVELRSADLYVHTYERGIGLTKACGTAMGAATHVAGLTGRLPFGQWITVHNPGGRVRVRAEGPAGDDRVSIAGNATFEWDGEIEIDPATGEAGALTVTRRRDDEVAAWAAVTG
ncbi:diaminopimelate epimerase [Sphingomonas sp. BT-65]|uniref:diaminopimelate epimerase n=1 Tax=Sphingomonas sp. BT-65 TaxID=2989821 RepID=UPI0022356B54|nr:diaminopimelate epimerase [Sphingomonas sp. BT-65]MCW4462228.1 diaminopimelate epimerase [Sphingomonas sp. BT-65]